MHENSRKRTFVQRIFLNSPQLGLCFSRAIHRTHPRAPAHHPRREQESEMKKSRATRFAVVAAAALAAVATDAQAATVTWNNNATPSADWSTPGSWSGNAVPV